MSMAEKIRVILAKRRLSEAELARRVGKTPQSLNSAMKRDNFNENDLKEIAKALECEYKPTFIMNDTKEEI